MLGVDRNAQRMLAEIHRQFREIRGLREGKEGVEPDYNRCIDIATQGALRELIPAGLVAILATLLVGFIGGVEAIGGFLLGNIASGLLLALFMSNAGGLWDNSKKYVEAGNEGGKGSEAHKAAVVGDTVGDPFKDTAGPSINTQITVVSLVSSLMSVMFIMYSIFLIHITYGHVILRRVLNGRAAKLFFRKRGFHALSMLHSQPIDGANAKFHLIMISHPPIVLQSEYGIIASI